MIQVIIAQILKQKSHPLFIWTAHDHLSIPSPPQSQKTKQITMLPNYTHP
jgi:hypothetical protein